jgi:23S rRNA (cytosine1962-C5)-methyltransferase
MEYGQVCLRRGEARGVRNGALWIYDNEIDWVDDTCQDGGLAEVLDERGKFLAVGFFNAKSKISVRILTRDRTETIDRAFFQRRIAEAWAYRQALGFSDACRVVFGESDRLPGLTVDKFGSCLSFQIVSLGMEQWKDTIISILDELFHPMGIYERDDVPVREKEGLALQKGCVCGTVPPVLEIREHDARMLVDIPNGQKTGHFLDQQENRGRLRPYAAGRRVLDLCCCTGGFSVHAALYGAKEVEAVDVSAEALALVQQNAARNGVADRISASRRPMRSTLRGNTRITARSLIPLSVTRPHSPRASVCCPPRTGDTRN